jgi:hypothetical protein
MGAGRPLSSWGFWIQRKGEACILVATKRQDVDNEMLGAQQETKVLASKCDLS